MRSERDKWLDSVSANKGLSDAQVEAALRVYLKFTDKRRQAFEKMIAIRN